MNSQYPRFSSKDEARAWLRNRNRVEPPNLTGIALSSLSGEEPLNSPDDLFSRQYRRLMAEAGYSREESSSLAEYRRLIEAEPDRPRLDLALQGGKIEGYEAPISLLGSFYTSLQSAITAVAQALTGAPTAAAQVPGYIRDATTLHSVALFPSSYGVHLFGPRFPQSVGLRPGVESRLLEESVTAICDIIDAAHVPNVSNEDAWEDRLAEQVFGWGQRAVKHLGDLSTLLGDAEVGMRLDWQPHASESRHSFLEPSGARVLKRISDGLDFVRTDRRRINGTLTGANLRRRTVEIQLDSGTIISARIAENLAARLRENILGRRITADAEVSVAHYATGRERELYTLTSLRASSESE